MSRSHVRIFLSIALAALTLAAWTGVLMRFGMIYGMPAWAQNFGAVRHAHSHLMYFGWVTLALMALIWAELPALTGRPLPRGVTGQMTVTAVLALLSFPAFWSNGYGLTAIGNARLPLGSMAATLNGLTWFLFIALYVRATRGLRERPLPIQLWDWALALMGLASVGALGLVGMVMANVREPLLQQIFFTSVPRSLRRGMVQPGLARFVLGESAGFGASSSAGFQFGAVADPDFSAGRLAEPAAFGALLGGGAGQRRRCAGAGRPWPPALAATARSAPLNRPGVERTGLCAGHRLSVALAGALGALRGRSDARLLSASFLVGLGEHGADRTGATHRCSEFCFSETLGEPAMERRRARDGRRAAGARAGAAPGNADVVVASRRCVGKPGRGRCRDDVVDREHERLCSNNHALVGYVPAITVFLRLIGASEGASCHSGSQRVKVLPWLSWLTTVILPLCAWAMR